MLHTLLSRFIKMADFVDCLARSNCTSSTVISGGENVKKPLQIIYLLKLYLQKYYF